MNRATEIELMRLLHGELPPEPARALRGRLEREPDLAAAWARLEATWNGLELPAAAAPPPAFAQSILARARREPAGPAGITGIAGITAGLSWAAAPTWARATAAVALAAGLALGAGAGSWAGAHSSSSRDEGGTILAAGAPPSSLAESYWDALDDPETGAGSGGAVQDGLL